MPCASTIYFWLFCWSLCLPLHVSKIPNSNRYARITPGRKVGLLVVFRSCGTCRWESWNETQGGEGADARMCAHCQLRKWSGNGNRDEIGIVHRIWGLKVQDCLDYRLNRCLMRAMLRPAEELHDCLASVMCSGDVLMWSAAV